MDSIFLNIVRAAMADVALDTAGTAVAASVTDITGATADARAALAAAAADTAVAAADARAALTGAAADTAFVAIDVAAAADAADSLGDFPSRLPRPPPLRSSRSPLCPLCPPCLPLLALKQVARAWLPSVPSKLLLSSSTRTRPPSRSHQLNSVFNAKHCFSGAYAGGRPFKTQRLVSCSMTSISWCITLSVKDLALAKYYFIDLYNPYLALRVFSLPALWLSHHCHHQPYSKTFSTPFRELWLLQRYLQSSCPFLLLW